VYGLVICYANVGVVQGKCNRQIVETDRMVMQTAKSGIAGILGDAAKKVFEQNKAKVEVPQDFGELPIGVSGIARLVRCGFKKIEEIKPGDKSGAKVGDYWFNAMGVVMEPTWFTDEQGNRHRVAGKQTRIIEAVFDTPKKSDSEYARSTQAEHVEWIIRQLKFLLGGTLQDFSVNDLDAICEILTKQRPYFAFSITGGKPTPQYPKPRGFHNWQGRVDDFVLSNQPAQPMVKDNTGVSSLNRDNTTKPTNGVNTSAQSSPSTVNSDRTVTTTSQERQRNSAPNMRETNVAPTPNDEPDEFGDIDSLIARANKGDDDATAELTEMAKNAGVPEKDVENAVDWTAVGVLIKDQKSDGAAAPPDEDEEGDGDDDEVFTPKADKVCRYKDKKKKKVVDVLCVKVNQVKGICTLKNMATEELYPNVLISEVLPPA
jgi:hypothetical protein